jgi:Tfp pilus assembly protein FimT
MNILKWVIVSLLSLALLIIAIAFALPNAYSVSRTETINAPAEKIYSLIAAPKQWKNW